jgi:hypothetical protein
MNHSIIQEQLNLYECLVIFLIYCMSEKKKKAQV